MTTKDTIRQWFNRCKAEGATHMLVVCDTYDYEDYPVRVFPGESAQIKATDYSGKNMQRVMECYDLSMDREEQLAEHRAFHY